MPAPSLHEVVQRIERRRRSRAMMRRGGLAPALPTSTSLFRWECGAGGEIAWVDGAPRGALIGRSIARARNGDSDHVDPEVVRAFTVRAPFRDAALTVAGDGLVAGEWKISGVPAFDPADGRFRGYRGVALREQAEIRWSRRRRKRLPTPIRFVNWSTRSNAAQCHHRLCGNHRGPISGSSGSALSRTRAGDRPPGTVAPDRHRRPRLRRKSSFFGRRCACACQSRRAGRANDSRAGGRIREPGRGGERNSFTKGRDGSNRARTRGPAHLPHVQRLDRTGRRRRTTTAQRRSRRRALAGVDDPACQARRDDRGAAAGWRSGFRARLLASARCRVWHE